MQKQLVVNGCLISFEETEEKPSAQTLLFLHGWRSQKEVWHPVRSGLAGTGLYTVALDLPGFGVSPASRQPFTVSDYALVVKEFIEKQAYGKVCLVGHSFGGRVAIKVASLYPQLVFKLVLVDSAGFPMPQSKRRILNTVAKFAKPFFKPRLMQGARKKIYDLLGAEDYLATPELQRTFVNVVNEDLTGDMEKIQAPTLIIFGEKDLDTPAEYGKRMQLKIPNSKFQILKAAGHFSFLDQTGEFVNILKDFVMSASTNKEVAEPRQ